METHIDLQGKSKQALIAMINSLADSVDVYTNK